MTKTIVAALVALGCAGCFETRRDRSSDGPLRAPMLRGTPWSGVSEGDADEAGPVSRERVGGPCEYLRRYKDLDGDGFGEAAGEVFVCATESGTVDRAGDCDDADPGVHPLAEDLCNGIDDDCSGGYDDDFSCSFGTEIPCVTEDGEPGVAACALDCSGFAACSVRSASPS